jgi:hypothetical protein
MHHVLARRGFNPPGIHFPVSAAILQQIDEYRGVLESYSRRLLPLIRWEPTPDGNVRVLNDTADFYRFFRRNAARGILAFLRAPNNRAGPAGRNKIPSEL